MCSRAGRSPTAGAHPPPELIPRGHASTGRSESQSVQGIDFELDYRIRYTPIGSFSLNFNASKLIGYYVGVPEGVQQVIDAKAAGTINAGILLIGGGDVVGRDGQPRWRLSAN